MYTHTHPPVDLCSRTVTPDASEAARDHHHSDLDRCTHLDSRNQEQDLSHRSPSHSLVTKLLQPENQEVAKRRRERCSDAAKRHASKQKQPTLCSFIANSSNPSPLTHIRLKTFPRSLFALHYCQRNNFSPSVPFCFSATEQELRISSVVCERERRTN